MVSVHARVETHTDAGRTLCRHRCVWGGAMRIGIVGGEGEQHTMRMVSILQGMGVEVLLIDTLNYPDKVSFSMRDDDVLYNGKTLEDVRSFYVRSVFYGEPPYDLEEKRRSGQLTDLDGWYSEYVSERERQAFLGSWMRQCSLLGKKLVNPVDCFQLHYLKPYQLSLLRKEGLSVPATLVSNDPEAVKAFYLQYKEVVFKPVAGGASCRAMKNEDITEERLKLLSSAPVIFQENVRGMDIRVFVLNGKVICALEIESDDVDFRGHEKAMNRVDLPPSVQEACLCAAKCCSMVFTGIDIKRTARNDYVILECNPSPMFIGFQEMSGYPIAEELARYLIEQ